MFQKFTNITHELTRKLRRQPIPQSEIRSHPMYKRKY